MASKSKRKVSRSTLPARKARFRSPDAKAIWTIRHAARLRADGRGSISQSELAAESSVGDDTVSKIERRIGVSKRSANRVFDALNVRHGGKLKKGRYVTRLVGA